VTAAPAPIAAEPSQLPSLWGGAGGWEETEAVAAAAAAVKAEDWAVGAMGQ